MDELGLLAAEGIPMDGRCQTAMQKRGVEGTAPIHASGSHACSVRCLPRQSDVLFWGCRRLTYSTWSMSTRTESERPIVVSRWRFPLKTCLYWPFSILAPDDAGASLEEDAV